MRPTIRSPQRRDRRLARARQLTPGVFVGAGAVSAVLTGYVAAHARDVTTTPLAAPTTTSTTRLEHKRRLHRAAGAPRQPGRVGVGALRRARMSASSPAYRTRGHDDPTGFVGACAHRVRFYEPWDH